MTAPLLSIGTIATSPDGTRFSSAAQRGRIGAVSGAAGRADLEGQRLRKLVVIQSRHQAVDDTDGILEICVEQHDRQLPLVSTRQKVGLTHVSADETRDVLDRLLALAVAAARCAGN